MYKKYFIIKYLWNSVDNNLHWSEPQINIISPIVIVFLFPTETCRYYCYRNYNINNILKNKVSVKYKSIFTDMLRR